MLALLLVGALLGQSALAKPTANCVEFCDDQSAVGVTGGVKTGGYSSYSKSSYRAGYSSGSSYGSSGGLGSAGSRLENLDDSTVGVGAVGIDTNRPGSWQDQKHYVTDDGHGEMKYKAGQTVTNNGYSKFAEHSYRYGTHDKHLPTANSQILSLDEFQREAQGIRSRIDRFMSSFNFASGSYVSSAMLQDFKVQAGQINSQLNNVCNQVDVGSSMYQQMQQMIQQFQRDVEQRQRQMEAMVFSSSSTSESYYQQPYHSTRPAPVQQYPTAAPSVNEVAIEQQRVFEQKFSEVQTQISSFYQNFNKPEISSQYQQNLNSQVEQIIQQLNNLSYQAVQNESARIMITQAKKSFEDYVQRVRSHIQELERREIEKEQRRKAEEVKIMLEKERLEIQKRDEEHARIVAEQKRQLELEAARYAAEKQKHTELKNKLEYELKNTQTAVTQPAPQYAVPQYSAPQVATQRPVSGGSFEVHGSSSYQHRVSGSIGAQGSTSGSYVNQRPIVHKPQPVLQPHIDLTAAFGQLQQDLQRLENEVNQFNMYTMRLTASNSARIQSEAEQQAVILRQNLKHLCDTSSQYQNQNVLSSAEALQRRFEQMVSNFETQAASYSVSSGYSSESSYGSSGSVSTVHSPSISNVEYTHSKSTEVEVGHRPASASRSGYSSSSGYSSAGAYGSQVDDQFSSGIIDLGGGSNQQQVECVEQYAGQPCVTQPRRYRRDVGEDYEPYYESNQRHQPIFDEFSDYARNEEFEPYAPNVDDYTQQHASPYDSYNPEDDLSQRVGPIALPREHQPTRNDRRPAQPSSRNLQGHPDADLTQQPGAIDDYYARQSSRDQFGRQVNPGRSGLEQQTEDLSQQHVSYGQNEDYESLQKPRSQVSRPVTSERSELHRQTEDLSQQTEDLSQQHISYGRNEDYESLQRPRSQILGTTQLSTSNVDEGQNENSQTNSKPGYESEQPHYPSRPQDESRKPQRPLPLSKPESGDFTLQKSGFYDYPRSSEKPGLNQESRYATPSYYDERRKPHTQTTTEEQTEEPQSVRPIGSFEKSESAQQSGDFTLEKSGFDYYPGRSERPILIGQSHSSTPSYEFGKSESTTEKPQTIRSAETQISESIQKPEDLTLEKSGFYDYPRQSEKPESRDKTEHVRPLVSDNLQLTQQSEQVSQQENISGSSFSRNERVEKSKRLDTDLTQQTTGQIDFGPESQAGRQFSSQGVSKPEKFGSSYKESQQTKPTSTRNSEFSHPTGQYIENLSQQHQQPPQNVQEFNSNIPNRQLESANSQSELIFSTTAKPAPKPEPRYTKPWQISQLHNIQTQPENKQAENTNIEEFSQDYQNDSASHSAPHRGDLPGFSEPSSTNPPLVEEKPTESSIYIPKPTTDCDSQQQYEKVDLNNYNQIHDISNHNRFDQTGGTYRFNQHSEYSHRSHYYNQNNGGIDLGQQIQKPFDQQNSYVEYDRQLKPTEFSQQQGGMYQYHQTGKLEFQHRQSSHYTSMPVQIDQQSGQLQYNRQTDFNQQVQEPAFEQLSSRSQFNQQQQSPFSLEQETSHKLENNLAAEIIPIDDTRPMDSWADIEEVTTPRTFWKRIGHKLSDSFDKAKERARTIFG